MQIDNIHLVRSGKAGDLTTGCVFMLSAWKLSFNWRLRSLLMSSFDVFVFKSNLAIRCRSAPLKIQIINFFSVFFCCPFLHHEYGGIKNNNSFVLLGFDIFIGKSAILAPYIYVLYSKYIQTQTKFEFQNPNLSISNVQIWVFNLQRMRIFLVI